MSLLLQQDTTAHVLQYHHWQYTNEKGTVPTTKLRIAPPRAPPFKMWSYCTVLYHKSGTYAWCGTASMMVYCMVYCILPSGHIIYLDISGRSVGRSVRPEGCTYVCMYLQRPTTRDNVTRRHDATAAAQDDMYLLLLLLLLLQDDAQIAEAATRTTRTTRTRQQEQEQEQEQGELQKK